MRLAALSIVLIAMSASCGYRLQTVHGGRFTDPSVRIDLEPFRNQSFDSDAGALVASRLREELRRNGFRGAFQRRDADFLIEGTVRQLREEVSTHGSDGFSLEHRISILVDIRVVEVAKGRLLWKEESISEGAAFFSGPDFQYTEANRRMAIEEVARRISRRLGQSLRMIL